MFHRIVIILTLFGNPAFGADLFTATTDDLSGVQSVLESVPKSTKLIVLADAEHRLPNTRALTALLARAWAEKFPGEKVCLFLETTEKVNAAYESYKSSDGTEGAYEQFFLPIAEKVSGSVSKLQTADAARIFVEPTYFVARYLRENAPNLNVVGVDVDYTNANVFAALYNNQKPPRKIDDRVFAKLFIADRNRSMAEKSKRAFQNGVCSKGIISAGNMHIESWNGDPKVFPKYSGRPIPGIIDLMDQKVVKKPFVIAIAVDGRRTCAKGQLKSNSDDCAIVSEQSSASRMSLQIPREFFNSRSESTSEPHHENPTSVSR